MPEAVSKSNKSIMIQVNTREEKNRHHDIVRLMREEGRIYKSVFLEFERQLYQQLIKEEGT